MRFGTFYFFQAAPGLSHAEVVHRELLKQLLGAAAIPSIAFNATTVGTLTADHATLLSTAQYGMHKDTAEVVQQSLAAVGVQVELQLPDDTNRREVVAKLGGGHNAFDLHADIDKYRITGDGDDGAFAAVSAC